MKRNSVISSNVRSFERIYAYIHYCTSHMGSHPFNGIRDEAGIYFSICFGETFCNINRIDLKASHSRSPKHTVSVCLKHFHGFLITHPRFFESFLALYDRIFEKPIQPMTAFRSERIRQIFSSKLDSGCELRAPTLYVTRSNFTRAPLTVQKRFLSNVPIASETWKYTSTGNDDPL